MGDDASTDNTVKILKQYSHHQNFNYTVNTTNLGFKQNFARAVKKSSGDIIAPCDQDDIWLPDKLQILISAMDDNLMVYSNSELIDEDNHKLGLTLKESLKINFISGDNYRAFYFGNCVAAHTMAFRKELLDVIFPFPETIYHDHWIAFIASRLGEIKYIDKKLVLYRKHSGSVTVADGEKSPQKKNIFSHLASKAERQSKRNKQKLATLKTFSDFNRKINKIDPVLEELIQALQDFDHCFINKNIFSILFGGRAQYFEITQKNTVSCAIKESLGKLFYRYMPIS